MKILRYWKTVDLAGGCKFELVPITEVNSDNLGTEWFNIICAQVSQISQLNGFSWELLEVTTVTDLIDSSEKRGNVSPAPPTEQIYHGPWMPERQAVQIEIHEIREVVGDDENAEVTIMQPGVAEGAVDAPGTFAEKFLRYENYPFTKRCY